MLTLFALLFFAYSCEEITDIDNDIFETTDETDETEGAEGDNTEESEDENLEDAENEDNNLEDTEDDEIVYEGAEFTLATIPTDGSTIEDDVWVITDAGDPLLAEFANLKSALASAGDEREITLYMPNVTSIPDYSITTYYDIDSNSTNEEDCNLSVFSAQNALDIGSNSFRECSTLKSVELSEAEEIGSYAFYGCTSITEISLPKAIEIGVSAFRGCSALESASLPAAIEIWGSAFYQCTILKSISLPEAQIIGSSTLRECSSLESISLPYVTEIGLSAFSSCIALESVSAPKVIEIENTAFSSCTALESMTLATESTSLSLGGSAFSNCTLSNIDLVTGANNGSTVDGNNWIVGDYTFGEFNSITVQ